MSISVQFSGGKKRHELLKRAFFAAKIVYQDTNFVLQKCFLSESRFSDSGSMQFSDKNNNTKNEEGEQCDSLIKLKLFH